MTKVYADIVVVDDDDNPIGGMQLPEAIKTKQIMRVVRVLVFNGARELLLQQRSQHVIAPGLWCESASGHVDVDEEYEVAAQREMQEELGLTDPITEAAYYYRVEPFGDFSVKRFSKLYTTKTDVEPTIDPHEVAGIRWITIPELEEWIKTTPSDFSNGFIFAYEQYKNASKK